MQNCIRSPLMRCCRRRRRHRQLLHVFRTCLMFITHSFEHPYHTTHIFLHQSRVDLKQYLCIFHTYFDFLPHFHSFLFMVSYILFTVIIFTMHWTWWWWWLLLSAAADDCRYLTHIL